MAETERPTPFVAEAVPPERAAQRIRRMWRDGRVAYGALCTMPSPQIVRLLAAGGLDWIIVDLEHGPIDAASAHAMILATSGTACAPFVRIASCEPWLAKAPMDWGACGINVPMVNDRAAAVTASRALRYPPGGDRAWGPFHAPAAWQLAPSPYMQAADEDMICLVTIEHADAIANIDEIVAVEGVDAAVIGIGDLATSIGRKGEPDHPEVTELVTRAEDAILASGVVLGGAARGPGAARAMQARGYRLLAVGFDWTLVQQGLAAALADAPR